MKPVRIEEIDFSKPRVRYQGKVQDKCDLSFLIHEVALSAGNSVWPLYSDIYWDTALYKELVDDLKKWVEKHKNKYNSNYK